MWLVVLALSVLAVGGGSATAAKLITGKQIKNGSIKSADIGDGAVTSGDIRNGSIRAGDLAPGATSNIANSVSAPPGPAGPAGPAGAVGPTGPAGPAGSTGIAEIVTAEATDFNAGEAVANCPRGTRPVSGGGIDLTPGGAIIASGATLDDNGRLGWAVISSDFGEVTAFAYCSAGVSSFDHPNGKARSGGGDALLSEADIERIKSKRTK